MKKILLLSAGLIFTAFLPVFAQINPSSNIIYVNKGVSGSDGSGDSWANAAPELADALQWARENLSEGAWNSANPLQIWVAKGTYKPLYSLDDDAEDDSPPILNSFVLIKDVQVYGGFAGNETSPADRTSWKFNRTILSGEMDEPYEEYDDWEEENVVFNSVCHVVVAAGEAGSALLDGFTVTGGAADYWGGNDVNGVSIDHGSGGGIYVKESTPVLRNLIVTKNSATFDGGGIYLKSPWGEEMEMKLSDLWVMENTAANYGGGIYVDEVKLATHNCILMGNGAERGGAFYPYWSDLSLVNTVIAGNYTTEISYAGGIYLKGGTLEIINSTISGNNGGPVYNLDEGYITAVKNSIIYNHGFSINNLPESRITNSLVQFITSDNGSNLHGGTSNPFTASVNPQFANGPSYSSAPFTNGDYRLKTNSPVIDKGADASYPGDLNNDTDPAGMPRFAGTSIDMGAYEGGYEPLPVTMASFEARREGNTAQLSWSTVLEVNASHFELQRSADGRIFDAIGTVQAKGEKEASGKTVHYRFSDYRPASPEALSYYRIKTVDKDGTYGLSAVVSVRWNEAGSIYGYIYPNPARGGKVNLDLKEVAGKSDIVVFDMSGRVVKVRVAEKSQGNYELETGGLSAGLYLVKAYREGQSVLISRLLVE